MKKGLSLIVLLLSVSLSQAQRLNKSEKSIFQKREDSLKIICRGMINDIEASSRFRKDSAFITGLVRALKLPNSFYYGFDSLETISKLYAPDSSFRIFTWQIMKDDAVFRRKGAIQMRTSDGSLKLFPLIDASHIISNNDTISGSSRWFGAIYYHIVQNKDLNGDQVYTLFGYDEHSIRSTRKRLEILRFNQDGYPVLGGPYFSFDEDTIPKPLSNRFFIEFKKGGRATMRYEPEQKIILFDHLISETNQPEKKYTFIPDGDYEGFKWKNGRWVHIEKVFTFKLEDGQAPVEQPLFRTTQPAASPKAPPTKQKP